MRVSSDAKSRSTRKVRPANSRPAGGKTTGEFGPRRPVGLWTWYDIRGAVCGNGTTTGIGVNQGSGSQVLIFMSSGSACLDQELFAAELAASFPDASRVILTGGSAGSVGAMLNYWQWVDAFQGTRVDLVSDSFALVFADGAAWRHTMHHAQVPPGCPTCGTDYPPSTVSTRASRPTHGWQSSIPPTTGPSICSLATATHRG